MDSSSDRLEPVELLADEFMERHRRGENPTIQEYIDRYPEHSEEIRDVFPALAVIERVAPVSADLADSYPTGKSGTSRLEKVGDYRILREIGRGGMGIVYEAEQQSLRRRVALKVIPKNQSGDAKRLERFQREARAAARMHHTNIVPVFEVGSDDCHVFYAMQLIQGQGLDHVVNDLKNLRTEACGNGQLVGKRREAIEARSIAASLVSGKFDEQKFEEDEDPVHSQRSQDEAMIAVTIERTLDSTSSAKLPGASEISTADSNRDQYFRSVALIGLQTAEAMAYAHARGIIHRDIKPSNLLLDTAGTVWITDFGLAKTSDSAMTHTGDILGTIRYMSPERFKGMCDVRADVYSLGLTLYELLTLTPAFESSDRVSLIEMVTNRELKSPRSIDSRIPRDLETIVLKACDKDPRSRYQSADEIADDLERFTRDEPIRARRISIVEKVGRWGRRNKRFAAALFVIALLLLAINIAGPIVTWRIAQLNTRLQKSLEETEQREREATAVNEFLFEDIIAYANPKNEPDRDITLRDIVDRAALRVGEKFESVPLVEASIQQLLGETYAGLGEAVDAERHLERAIEIRSELLGKDHPLTLESMHSLGLVQFNRGMAGMGVDVLKSTLELRKQVLGEDDQDTLQTMMIYAQATDDLELMASVLKKQERVLGLAHPDTLYSTIFVNLWPARHGNDAVHGKDVHMAKLQEVAETAECELGELHPLALLARSTYASVLVSHRRFADAIPVLRPLLDRQEKILGPDHVDTLWTTWSLGACYTRSGEFDEAQLLLEPGYAIAQKRFTLDADVTQWLMDTLADTYIGQGKRAKGEELYRKQLEIRKRTFGLDNARTIWTVGRLVGICLDQDRNEDAIACVRDNQPLGGWAPSGLAVLYAHLGNRNEYVNQIPVILKDAFDESTPPLRRVMSVWAALAVPGDNSTTIAVQVLPTLIEMDDKDLPAVTRGEDLTNMHKLTVGLAHLRAGRTQDAIDYFDQVNRLPAFLQYRGAALAYQAIAEFHLDRKQDARHTMAEAADIVDPMVELNYHMPLMGWAESILARTALSEARELIED